MSGLRPAPETVTCPSRINDHFQDRATRFVAFDTSAEGEVQAIMRGADTTAIVVDGRQVVARDVTTVRIGGRILWNAKALAYDPRSSDLLVILDDEVKYAEVVSVVMV